MIKRLGYFLLAVALFISANSAVSMVSAQSTPPVAVSLLYNQQTSRRFQPNVLDIKVQPSAGLKLVAGRFVGGNSGQTARLNVILRGSQHGPRTSTVVNLAGQATNTALDQADTSVSALSAAVGSAVSSYYRVTFAATVQVMTIAAQLSALSSDIAYAYPSVMPAPAPTVPLYTSLESYIKAAPTGIDTSAAVKFAGSQGAAINLVDIEYSWNTAHVDLSKARTALRPDGTPVDPFQDNNHGTAVLGELVGDSNAYGVTGIVSNTNLKLINVNSAQDGYDPAGALLHAARLTKPGDVVLIEQQAWGPTGAGNDFVPVEWIPEVYDAIKALTSNGVIVVEPAGNGYQSLDNAAKFGGTFPLGRPSSGAIIVGAAENCAGSSPRTWLSFSNYGSRVDLQGPGDCVATTGYGDLYDAAGTNNAYTSSFSGTSSAAPVVAGAAAALSSAYEHLNNGAVLAPATITSILKATGTPQTGSQAGTNHIGPLPNLARALLSADNTPPSVINLAAGLTSAGLPRLTWQTPTDNVQVTYYHLYRNGVAYKWLTPSTSFVDTAVTAGNTYSYQLYAGDEAGHHAALSRPVSIRVPAMAAGPNAHLR